MQVDVLIVGSGGAGLSAALWANKNTSNIAVLSKTYPTHSQTCQAQGGINAVLESTLDDSIEKFIEDTINGAKGLANKNQVETFCKESNKSIKWLDDIGVPFSRNTQDDIAQRRFGGTKAQRTCYSSDYTGLKILHTLYDQCLKEEIKFLNEFYLLDLIIENEKVHGVIALDMKNSELIQIKAKTVILAGGGYAGIYNSNTTNSCASTGDILSLALKNEVILSNLEFIQFHPTALKNKNILISESARALGAYLVDEDENRFIDELKPRDEVSQAIYKKTEEGKKVFLDLRHLDKEVINQTIPQEKRLINEFMNLDLHKDLIPINPAAHYSMGGIKTNKEMQTSIQNLYACGECTQSGIHGANRLGGNSLQEIISFGRIAGENAAKKANSIEKQTKNSNKQYEKDEKKIDELFEKKADYNFYEAKEELGKHFFTNVGLFREENKLLNTLDFINKTINKLKEVGISDKSKTYNKNLVDFIEFENMLLLSEIIVKSALNRKESRGAHYRVDFTKEKKDFDKNSISVIKDNKLHQYFEDVL